MNNVIENFSLSSLNPVNGIKDLLKFLFIFLIKAIVAGVIMTMIMKKTGLMSEASIKNYVKYAIIGSLVMFGLTMSYFAYLSRNGKNVDYKKLAKASLLGPSVIMLHIIILIVSVFMQDLPEVGPLVYILIWSSIGATLITGIAYTTGLEIAEKAAHI